MTTTTEATYSTIQAAEITGATYRQVDYFDRIGLIEPSVRRAKGSGSCRAYNYDDLLVLRVVILQRTFWIKTDSGGVPPKLHRPSIEVVRLGTGRSWWLVVAAGGHAWLAADLADLDALDGPLLILSLKSVIEHVNARIKLLVPEQPDIR